MSYGWAGARPRIRARSSSSKPAEGEALLEIDALVRHLREEENEVVRIEEPADVRDRAGAAGASVPHALETVHLETDERVDRPELIGDEDPAAGRVTRGELGDREARLADVVKNAVAAHEVERGVAERSCITSPSTRRTLAGAFGRPGVEVVGSRVHAHHLGDVRRERERNGARARSPRPARPPCR
jgi:hypothetical protein